MNIMQFLSRNRIFMSFIIMLVHVDKSCQFFWDYSDRVKLTSIRSLTLYSGSMTTSRRSYPVPQVKCVGGNAGCQAVVNVVTCHNEGTYSGTEVLWKCRADLNRAYRFGRTDVNCEGYDYTDDPYVLRGSCGVEYTLFLRHERQMDAESTVGILIVVFVALAIFIAVAVICCYSIQEPSPTYYTHQPYRYQEPYGTSNEVIVIDHSRPRRRTEEIIFHHQPPQAHTYAGTTRRRRINSSNITPAESTSGFGRTVRR